jgi:hypothetical protein
MVCTVKTTFPVASRAKTIETILEDSERPGRTPLRVRFLQQSSGSSTAPGPLSRLVRRGRESALDLYLLALTLASSSPYDVRRDSRYWARACGLATDASGRAAISRNWRLLADLGLVSITRKGRLANVTILREDGTGAPYTHPGKGAGSRYLQLPFAYWRDGHSERLTLPGKAMLLVALSLPDAFPLPNERGPAWYGLSPSTVERGFRELRRADVLTAKRVPIEAPRAPEGYTIVNLYTLLPPFGPCGQMSTAGRKSFPESPTQSPSLQAEVVVV